MSVSASVQGWRAGYVAMVWPVRSREMLRASLLGARMIDPVSSV